MEIAHSASDGASAAIGRIGRTEDARFSPDGRRLALAGLTLGRLLILDVETHLDVDRPHIVLADFLEIDSPSLRYPHGLLWLDERTLVVANRHGQVQFFELPANRPAGSLLHLEPQRTIGADAGELVSTPGSISVSHLGLGLIELLVCNNYVHHVSRHLLDQRNGLAVAASEILLHDGLGVPDGITQSKHWIAVSNHDYQNVFVYSRSAGLNPSSRPDAVLGGIAYPHGLKFVDEGRSLLVADAGAPFVHLFTSDDGDWTGERRPVRSIRVLDDETFARGYHSPLEGGPKGMDVTPDGRIMVTSCHERPLAFFDLQALQIPIAPDQAEKGEKDEAERVREALVGYLSTSETRLREAIEVINREGVLAEEKREAEIMRILDSRSWRVTAPLRRMKDVLTSVSRASRKAGHGDH